MRRFSWFLMMLVMVSIFVVGCSDDGPTGPGDSDDPDDPPVKDQSYLPLHVGNWWEYTYEYETYPNNITDSTRTRRIEVTGTQMVNGQEFFVLEATKFDESNNVIGSYTRIIRNNEGTIERAVDGTIYPVVSLDDHTGDKGYRNFITYETDSELTIGNENFNGYSNCRSLNYYYRFDFYDGDWTETTVSEFYVLDIGLVGSEFFGHTYLYNDPPLYDIYVSKKVTILLTDYFVQ